MFDFYLGLPHVFGGIKQDRETEEGSSHQESNLRSLV